ncbi:MAG: alpha/beta hydrolase [Rhodomicrobium sp.]|nr:alpha/beta hydrolase [Rhodomicrobium sp.]
MQTVEQARFYYRGKATHLGGPAAPMAAVRNLRATGPEGDVPLRLYCPKGVTKSGPALIYAHGGGWVLGDLESHDKVCRGIAAQTPCRVLAVDYRLAPEHPFPAGLNDVLAAVAWIANNAHSLGVDNDRLAIGGDSAGGSMAAAACLHARDNGPKLCAQVLIYPSTDSTPEVRLRPSRIQNGDVPPLDRSALRWLISKYLPQRNIDRRDWRLSPLYAESLAGLPPALVLTAEYDPLRDEGKAYADRLSASEVPVVYRDFPGQIHGFIEYGGVLTSAHEAIREIARFLRAHT